MKKKKELNNNNREINNLKLQEKLLKNTLDNLEKPNKLKTEEINELKDKIDKLKEARIDKKLSKMTKIFQDTRKKDPSTIPKILQDDKARTFAPTGLEIAYLPKYGEESDRSKHLLEEKENISNPENKLKKTNTKHFFDPEKKVQKLNPKYIDKFFKNDKLKEFYSYESEISNARINYFDRIINENPEISIRKISIITKLKKKCTKRNAF